MNPFSQEFSLGKENYFSAMSTLAHLNRLNNLTSERLHGEQIETHSQTQPEYFRRPGPGEKSGDFRYITRNNRMPLLLSTASNSPALYWHPPLGLMDQAVGEKPFLRAGGSSSSTSHNPGRSKARARMD